jgi:hypothetical protein
MNRLSMSSSVGSTKKSPKFHSFLSEQMPKLVEPRDDKAYDALFTAEYEAKFPTLFPKTSSPIKINNVDGTGLQENIHRIECMLAQLKYADTQNIDGKNEIKRSVDSLAIKKGTKAKGTKGKVSSNAQTKEEDAAKKQRKAERNAKKEEAKKSQNMLDAAVSSSSVAVKSGITVSPSRETLVGFDD